MAPRSAEGEGQVEQAICVHPRSWMGDGLGVPTSPLSPQAPRHGGGEALKFSELNIQIPLARA